MTLSSILSYQNVEQINYYYTFYTFLSLSCKNKMLHQNMKLMKSGGWRTTSGLALSNLTFFWLEKTYGRQCRLDLVSCQVASDIASEMTVCKSRRVTAPECPNIMCNVCPADTLTTFIHTRLCAQLLSGVSSIVRIRIPNESN